MAPDPGRHDPTRLRGNRYRFFAPLRPIFIDRFADFFAVFRALPAAFFARAAGFFFAAFLVALAAFFIGFLVAFALAAAFFGAAFFAAGRAGADVIAPGSAAIESDGAMPVASVMVFIVSFVLCGVSMLGLPPYCASEYTEARFGN
ncbi:MAG TPA: hypothetical protein VFO19_23660 [Vicinamibacterales bacterium]|nr:hypothetical protein [Vicinamibacterales bacterium]